MKNLLLIVGVALGGYALYKFLSGENLLEAVGGMANQVGEKINAPVEALGVNKETTTLPSSPTLLRRVGIISPVGEARQWLDRLYAQHSHTTGLPQIQGDIEAISRWRTEGQDVSGEIVMAADNYGVEVSTIEAAVAHQDFIIQQIQERNARYVGRGEQLREYAAQRVAAGGYVESFPEFQKRMGY